MGRDTHRDIDSTHLIRRRNVLAAGTALAAALFRGSPSSAELRTRLILLGTGGGPRPRKQNSAAAQVILIDDVPYVIDCGNGIARQLVFAGVPLHTLRYIFITHHHSDHNADYGNLISLAWTTGLITRVDAWGPPPLVNMTRLFFEMNAADIRGRIASEGRVPLEPLVHPHELTDAGEVMKDERVRVSAALVPHPPMVPSFAYRFDTAARSIVISGDTARSNSVVALAKGADVLVHSAFFPAAIERLGKRVPNAPKVGNTIDEGQTSVEDAARIARMAGVKTLVLSHLIPADDPEVTDEMWMSAARTQFSGKIIVGRDLMVI
jgi:ribonuclease BN (tRNA processing enzyme)